MHIEAIETPALIVDVEVLERNISAMSAYFDDRPAKLRPHFKAHKTPEIMARQLAGGNCVGVTCATVNEAEVCRRHGFGEILIANEPVGPNKAARCVAVAEQTALIVAVDSETGLRELSQSAAGRCEIGVVIDINVGMPRCGVKPESAPALAHLASELDGVAFRGLMGYEGHAVLMSDETARRSTASQSMSTLLEARELVQAAGLEVEIVSGGGTGTYSVTGAIEGITEIQAGSYALMDDAYLGLGLGFERAAYVAATVISRPSAHLAIADAGLKAFAMDHGEPSVIGPEPGSVMFLSDEHASLRVEEDAYPVGSKIQLSIAHIDPTVNLFDQMWAVAGREVVGEWEVEARGYPGSTTRY